MPGAHSKPRNADLTVFLGLFTNSIYTAFYTTILKVSYNKGLVAF